MNLPNLIVFIMTVCMHVPESCPPSLSYTDNVKEEIKQQSLILDCIYGKPDR